MVFQEYSKNLYKYTQADRLMIHILDHRNNVSIAFPMSENLRLVTLVLIIPAILANIHGFRFFTFR